ncbi:tyrosine-type recombinase/integrase [Belnapia moabensis]|uniref:tyrosine-type recombinase/integrase n=1 Tax=Belnapia moabensis TaxID=365533 RepID=UPI000B0B4E09|nr:site-specific integrase [Belnapia moabensis]
MRFSIPSEGQIRRSLRGAKDSAEAERMALQVYAEALHRARLGLRSRAKTFREIAEEFVAQLQREAERMERRQFQVDQWRRIVERYFLAFFGDQAIDGITVVDINRYREWRKDYWTTGPGKDVPLITYMRGGRQIRRPITAKMRKPPSPSALRSEFVVLRLLCRFAAQQGYINTAQVPEIHLTRVPANARPSFEAHEFTRLEQVSLQRIADPKINDHVRRDRAVLHAYCMIAAYTGCRPTELLGNLTWGDVLGYRECRELPIGHRDIRLRVRGKGKHRTFVPMLAALPWIDQLWEFWVKAMSSEPNDDDPVFATSAGKRLGSVKKSLSELLKAAGLLTDHRGARRTAYSFRHFYISQQLIAGVDVFLLAKNTGTSSDMIERFYGQVKLERMAKELRPEWRMAGEEKAER